MQHQKKQFFVESIIMRENFQDLLFFCIFYNKITNHENFSCRLARKKNSYFPTSRVKDENFRDVNQSLETLRNLSRYLLRILWFSRGGLTVASPGFFRWGTPRPLKGYHAPPPRRGPGGEGPPDGSEVSFFQTMQSIRKWIEFSKISIFFLPKNLFFSKKKFEKLNIFDRNWWIFFE